MPEKKYTHDFIIACGPSNSVPSSIKNAYLDHWKRKYADPAADNITAMYLTCKESLTDDTLKPLQNADNNSRITIIAHHELWSDFLYMKNTLQFHYREIADAIRAQITCKDILLTGDTVKKKQALHIRFISCNIFSYCTPLSLADNMMAYLCSHQTKPLRVKLTAPATFCVPFIGDKQINITRLNAVAQLAEAAKSNNPSTFHKRYGFFWFEHKPKNRKRVFEVESCEASGKAVIQSRSI